MPRTAAVRGPSSRGPLHDYFASDHRRLDGLLRRSVEATGPVALEPFGEFRSGLLRHIGMEEKLLFPAVRAYRSGDVLGLAGRLRVDHGALAALLVPTPTRPIVAQILALLVPHNLREEQLGGIYDACDEALGRTRGERLVEELTLFPAPPLKPYNDAAEVFRHIESNVQSARRQWEEPGAGRR